MYAGRQVEHGTVDDIFYSPRHPYTRALLGSLPRLDRRHGNERLRRIKGQPPSLIFLPSGCAFHTRCPYAIERCRAEVPALLPLGEVEVACHRAAELL